MDAFLTLLNTETRKKNMKTQLFENPIHSGPIRKRDLSTSVEGSGKGTILEWYETGMFCEPINVNTFCIVCPVHCGVCSALGISLEYWELFSELGDILSALEDINIVLELPNGYAL